MSLYISDKYSDHFAGYYKIRIYFDFTFRLLFLILFEGRKVPCDLPKRSKNTEKGICVKKIWSNEEKEIILKKFRTLIKIGKLPGKQECEELMEEHKIFTGRKWTDLKYFVKNYLSKCKKIS